MFDIENGGKDYKAQKAEFLGKWLWVLFWLFIPGVIASFMVNENVISMFPALYFPGEILQLICQVAYGILLLKVSEYDTRYKISGCIIIIVTILGFVVNYVFYSNDDLYLVMLIPLGVAGLVGEYFEYIAHSGVLEEFDPVTSAKWKKLWIWYIGSFGVFLASMVAVFILSPIIGLLIMLVSAIAIIVVSILKLVYLYRTAKTFRDYRENNPDIMQSGFTGSDF